MLSSCASSVQVNQFSVSLRYIRFTTVCPTASMIGRSVGKPASLYKILASPPIFFIVDIAYHILQTIPRGDRHPTQCLLHPGED